MQKNVLFANLPSRFVAVIMDFFFFYSASLRTWSPSGQSVHQSESFENFGGGGLIETPDVKKKKKKKVETKTKYLSPPTNTTTSLVENWITLPSPPSPPPPQNPENVMDTLREKSNCLKE